MPDRKSVVVGQVTGVQTCALPILEIFRRDLVVAVGGALVRHVYDDAQAHQLFERNLVHGVAAGGEVDGGVEVRAAVLGRGGVVGGVIVALRGHARSEERRGGTGDWSSDVCSSDLGNLPP